MMHSISLALALLRAQACALPHRSWVTGNFRPQVIGDSHPQVTGAPHHPALHDTGPPSYGSPQAQQNAPSSTDKHSSAAPAAAGSTPLTAITVTIVNSMKSAIRTSVTGNAGAPALLEGSGVGTMAAGATASIVAPRGWNGNVALGLALYDGFHSPSLIEAGLVGWAPAWEYMMDLDVSYVNGYTVSATCICNDASSTWLTGCSTDLWSQSAKCGDAGETDLQSSAGVCVNPTNDGTFGSTEATAFFRACQGMAYTFPGDNKANSLGFCASGAATCCVGTTEDGCMASPS